jgi:hypothetical protein
MVYARGRPPELCAPADEKLLARSSALSPALNKLLLLLLALPSSPAAAPAAVDTLPCTIHVKAAMGAAELLLLLSVLLLLLLGWRGKARMSLQVVWWRAALASWGVMVATAAPRGVLSATWAEKQRVALGRQSDLLERSSCHLSTRLYALPSRLMCAIPCLVLVA